MLNTAHKNDAVIDVFARNIFAPFKLNGTPPHHQTSWALWSKWKKKTSINLHFQFSLTIFCTFSSRDTTHKTISRSVRITMETLKIFLAVPPFQSAASLPLPPPPPQIISWSYICIFTLWTRNKRGKSTWCMSLIAARCGGGGT